MHTPKIILISAVLLVTANTFVAQSNTNADVWQPMKYFVGEWEGIGNGKPGTSKVQRDYRLVLNGKFLQVQNRSEYAPQTANPKGESHRSEEHTSELQSRLHLVCRLLLEKKNKKK